MLDPETVKKMEKEFREWVDANAPKREHELSPEQDQIIRSRLGYAGRMLSGSKRPIKTKEGKEHLTVFNANLIVEGYDKVWFGDIDITKDEKLLQEIAKELKAKVYVLREMDARFETENKPRLSEAVYVTDGTSAEIKNPLYAQYYERNVNGKILSRKDAR
jgi:hypothetical protein